MLKLRPDHQTYQDFILPVYYRQTYFLERCLCPDGLDSVDLMAISELLEKIYYLYVY